MGQTRAEQETIIRWDEAEQIVHVYSTSPKTWRRCARLGLEATKSHRFRDGEESGRFYRLPLAEFRWGLRSKRRGGGNAAALAAARERRQRVGTP